MTSVNTFLFDLIFVLQAQNNNYSEKQVPSGEREMFFKIADLSVAFQTHSFLLPLRNFRVARFLFKLPDSFISCAAFGSTKDKFFPLVR